MNSIEITQASMSFDHTNTYLDEQSRLDVARYSYLSIIAHVDTEK